METLQRQVQTLLYRMLGRENSEVKNTCKIPGVRCTYPWGLQKPLTVPAERHVFFNRGLHQAAEELRDTEALGASLLLKRFELATRHHQGQLHDAVIVRW